MFIIKPFESDNSLIVIVREIVEVMVILSKLLLPLGAALTAWAVSLVGTVVTVTTLGVAFGAGIMIVLVMALDRTCVTRVPCILAAVLRTLGRHAFIAVMDVVVATVLTAITAETFSATALNTLAVLTLLVDWLVIFHAD